MNPKPGAAKTLAVTVGLVPWTVVLLTQPLQAATIHVSNLNDSGAGSLRAAIGASGLGGTVDFPGLNGTIQVTSGEFALNQDINIIGPGATNLAIVSTNSRLFNIQGATVTISGLRLTGATNGLAGADATGVLSPRGQDGTAPLPPDTSGFGGGGAICNFGGNLTVANCVFVNCSVRGGSGGSGYSGVSTAGAGGNGGRVSGGAIFMSGGNIALNGCTFFSNSISGGLGGNGGTANSGAATPGGTGGTGGEARGGAIATGYGGGYFTIVNCTFSLNKGQGGTGGYGGNGFLGGAGGVGGNGGPSEGGAVYINSGCDPGSCDGFKNSTISLNQALSGIGGPGGTNIFYGSPVASSGSSGSATGGGLAGAPIPVLNMIIAGNTFSNVGGAPDVSISSIFSLGNNLIGKTDGSTGWMVNDLTGTVLDPLDPMLAYLADNGGPTPTMALQPCSPAMDAGADIGLPTDQRGYPRPSGAHTDIGAYEFQGAPPACLTVTTPCNGVVIRNPNLPNYPSNSVVQLTAVPDQGWAFAGWLGDASGTTNPLNVAITSGKSITALFSPLASPCSCPVAGLINWWPAGNNTNDIIGPSDGVLTNGATFATGKVGQAFSFSGVDGQEVALNSSVLPPPWTVECWVNRQDSPQPSALLMSDGSTALKLEQYPNTRKVGFTQYGVADYTFNYTAPVGTWVHLAFVGSSANTQLYVNGAPQDSVPAGINLGIGEIGNAVNGLIDEVSVYNRALTSTEIQDIYNAGSSGKCLTPAFITTVSMSSNNITVSWLAQPKLTYRLQYKTSLNPGAPWTDVGGDVIATGLSASKTDVLPANSLPRFYRVQMFR